MTKYHHNLDCSRYTDSSGFKFNILSILVRKAFESQIRKSQKSLMKFNHWLDLQGGGFVIALKIYLTSKASDSGGAHVDNWTTGHKFLVFGHFLFPILVLEVQNKYRSRKCPKWETCDRRSDYHAVGVFACAPPLSDALLVREFKYPYQTSRRLVKATGAQPRSPRHGFPRLVLWDTLTLWPARP